MTIIARHLIVKGRVQGVWFRGWTAETADSLGLTGWVRNLSGGEVEAFVQGETGAVERFLTLIWEGPSAARVDAVDVKESPLGEFHGFEQRATV